MPPQTLILGIESSCDETAAAVVRDGRDVLSNVIASQNDLHAKYGGVVPEIASRAHLERISPVIAEALTAAQCRFEDLDAIAVGNRPGLIGSLLVGVSAAKALAWALGKPLIGVDHVQAHLYAGLMSAECRLPIADCQLPIAKEPGADDYPSRARKEAAPFRRPEGPLADARGSDEASNHAAPSANSQLEIGNWQSAVFPALGLVVSGGHTSLYELASPLEMRVLGKTIDDAVGEAYDKAAVILQLGYPGGPLLDKLAQSVLGPSPLQGEGGCPQKFGGDRVRVGRPVANTPSDAHEPRDLDLPRTLLGPDSLDFSFSGLKTALLYKVRGFPVGRGDAAHFSRSAEQLTAAEKADLAAAFQTAAVDTLIIKLQRAIEYMERDGRPPRSLLIGGGVSANSLLRRRAAELAAARGLRSCQPPMSLCLDNAAMIAGLAHEHFRAGRFDTLDLPAIATTSV